jgi:hypothetical protein
VRVPRPAGGFFLFSFFFLAFASGRAGAPSYGVVAVATRHRRARGFFFLAFSF